MNHLKQNLTVLMIFNINNKSNKRKFFKVTKGEINLGGVEKIQEVSKK